MSPCNKTFATLIRVVQCDDLMEKVPIYEAKKLSTKTYLYYGHGHMFVQA